jgi:hypothetical protein
MKVLVLKSSNYTLVASTFISYNTISFLITYYTNLVLK